MRRLKPEQNELIALINTAVTKLISGQKSITLTIASLLKLPTPKPDEKPHIIISEIAYKKMRTLVAQYDKELAWHGTVTVTEDGTYRIEDILVYPQLVTGATVESDDDLYPLWLDELDDDVFNKIRMQGHSHVNMGVTPSGTDTDFYSTLTKHINDFYIFIILNKSNKMHIELHDIKNNVLYEDTDINVQYEGKDYTSWCNKQIDEYISTKYSTPYNSNNAYARDVAASRNAKSDTKKKEDTAVDDYYNGSYGDYHYADRLGYEYGRYRGGKY